MPSNPLAGTLLSFSRPSEGSPHGLWGNETWQELTKHTLPPCFVDSREGGSQGCDASAVVTFAKNFWSLDPARQLEYMKVKPEADKDNEGRKLWRDWFSKNWHTWKVNSVVDGKLLEMGLHPYTLMRAKKMNMLPDMATCQIQTKIPVIAEVLFGEEAYDDPFTKATLKSEIYDFTNSLLVSTWTRLRATVARERKSLPIKLAALEEFWIDITREGTSPSKQDIKKYIRACETVVEVLRKYGDLSSIENLNNNRVRLVGMMQAMGSSPVGQEKSRLPKPLREALERLATESQIQAMTSIISEFIARFDPESGEEEEVTLMHDEDDINLDWQEGVESYKAFSEEDIWNRLGLPRRTLPFFNQQKDPNGIFTTWTPEGRAFFEDPTKSKVDLRPNWHQLVGIDKMVVRAFTGGPTLLMDEVGLGKTLQLVGFIAVLTFFRDFFNEKGHFPGAFAESKWKGTDGNIPALASILAVPVNIQDQMAIEFRRYLAPGSFDILPYQLSLKSRTTWWTNDAWSKGILPEGRRIVLAGITSLNSDCETIYEPNTVAWLPASKSSSFSKRVASTVYGRNWLVFGLDEAHNCRNVNKAYMSSLMLRIKSEAFVAMTATPLTTKLMDLWNLGRVMGIAGFGTSCDDEAKQMTQELRKASGKDRKDLRNDGGNLIRGIVMGESGGEQPVTEHGEKMKFWIRIIREKFQGTVIRRTVNSVDYRGKRISGLEPYQEHPMILNLYDHEQENLNEISEELVRKSGGSAVHHNGGRFYLSVRRALTHKTCNDASWEEPKSIADWNKNPSRKIDALVEILKYHLAEDGRQPLTAVNGVIGADPKCTSDGVAGGLRDKIVIFANFPSANDQILPVLKLHGIDEVLVVNGDIPLSQRAKAIEEFNSKDGPRVLILSSVGTVGLNLPIANIMIVLDTLWSAQDDRQLIGRIWRQPQPKPVHIYRLIANNSPDVFLNNISFDKATMHEAFTGCSKEMREAFQGAEPEDHADVGVDRESSKKEGRKAGSSKKKRPEKAKTSKIIDPSLSTEPVQALSTEGTIIDRRPLPTPKRVNKIPVVSNPPSASIRPSLTSVTPHTGAVYKLSTEACVDAGMERSGERQIDEAESDVDFPPLSELSEHSQPPSPSSEHGRLPSALASEDRENLSTKRRFSSSPDRPQKVAKTDLPVPPARRSNLGKVKPSLSASIRKVAPGGLGGLSFKPRDKLK